AVAAVRHERQDHAVAGLHHGDALAHALHGAGALVAEHGRHGDGRLAFLEVQVAAADTGRAYLDEDLAVLGRVQLDGLDRVRLVDVVEHSGGDAHWVSCRPGVGPAQLSRDAAPTEDRGVVGQASSSQSNHTGWFFLYQASTSRILACLSGDSTISLI